MSEWVRERMRVSENGGQLFVHTNAGIRVVTHACTVQCEFMKAREIQSGREWENGEITKGVLVCVCTTSEPHWPDELCSLQKMDFSEMRGSKPRDELCWATEHQAPRAGFLVGLLKGWSPCVMWILFVCYSHARPCEPALSSQCFTLNQL